MKKVFLSTLMLITTFCLSAQKGKNSLQLNGGYGSKIESIGGGVQFNLAMSKKMEFAPSINQFAKKDGISVKEVNLDLHYLIPIVENPVRVAPSCQSKLPPCTKICLTLFAKIKMSPVGI